jgi:peroxiredoxin
MNRLLLALIFCLAATLPTFGQTAVTLEGQIVCCAECWAEADRNKVEYGTTENLLKAKSCVEGGDPTLLAVREGNTFKLYQLATGKFRLAGKNWLEFVGKRVAVKGTLQNKKAISIVRVDSLEVLAPSPAEREASKLVGQEVGLRLRDLMGVEQSLLALKGRIVVLNFWATYCIPCRTEMPDLAAIQNEFAPFGVQIIGVSTDAAEDRNKVLQFVKETRINFPIWLDGSTEHMTQFGLGAALPGTVIIGKDGRIIKVISGVVNQAGLRKQIEALIGPPATVSQSAKDGREVTTTTRNRTSEVSSVPS